MVGDIPTEFSIFKIGLEKVRRTNYRQKILRKSVRIREISNATISVEKNMPERQGIRPIQPENTPTQRASSIRLKYAFI